MPKRVRTRWRETSRLCCAEAKSTKQDASGGLPPAVVHQLSKHGLADGRAELGVEHHQQRVVHCVSVEAQVVGKFGDARALSGEHNLSGSVVQRQNGLSQLTAGLCRLPHLCVDVVQGTGTGTTEVQGRSRRSDVRAAASNAAVALFSASRSSRGHEQHHNDELPFGFGS